MNWLKKIWKGFSEPLPPHTPHATTSTGPTVRVVHPEPAEESLNNFTPRAQQVLALSRKQADRFNHNFVGTEHLLLGLIALGQGTAVNVLLKLGLDLETVRLEVERQVGTGPDQKIIGHIPYTPRVKRVLSLAAKEAKALNHTYVGTEHLLLGLLLEGDGVAARVLKNLEVDIETTRQEILKELDPNFIPSDTASTPTEKLPVSSSGSPTKSTVPKKSRITEIDLTQRYDVYCSERTGAVVVYRNACFKGIRKMIQGSNDSLTDYYELEQSDGKTVFVACYSVIKFCEPGTTPNAEDVPGKRP